MLYATSGKRIRVRTPDWLNPNNVRVSGPAALRSEIESSAVWLKGVVAGPIILRFEQPEAERNHIVAGRTYGHSGAVILWFDCSLTAGRIQSISEQHSTNRRQLPNGEICRRYHRKYIGDHTEFFHAYVNPIEVVHPG